MTYHHISSHRSALTNSNGPNSHFSRHTDYSTVVIVLFFFYVVGAHLRLSIYSGASILIPMYPMIISGFIVTIFTINALISATGRLAFILAIFLLIQPALSWLFGSRQEISITSSIQLFSSILCSFSFTLALASVEKTKLRRFSFFFWAALVILSLLESHGFRSAFDAVKEIIYAGSNRGVYADENRDMEIYGSVRSTVFASEPSFLADSLCSLSILVFMLAPQINSLYARIQLASMLLICAVVSPSFKLVFYALAAILWSHWPRNLRHQIFTGSALIIIAMNLWLFMPSLMMALSEFIGQHGETGSFYGRVQVGPEVAARTLSEFPLFGYGLGGADEVYPAISSIWFNNGAFQKFPWYIDLGARDLMSNGFWWQWIFLGIVGGFIFITLLLRIMSGIGIAMPMRALVCSWIVWYAGSAFVDPQSWFMIIIFSIGSMKKFNPINS